MKQLTKKEKYYLACSNLSPDVIKNLSPHVINNLSPDVIKNLSPYAINNLSPYVINNLSPDVIVIKNLSPYAINNLSPDVIKNLSPDVINLIKEKIKEFDEIPVLKNPYTTLLEDINDKKRIHQQSTFGEIETFEQFCEVGNVCKTPMCTAGHLVSMCGKIGYKLKQKYGWSIAANLIHLKAYPNYPSQNFRNIPQDHAIAYIEYMAELESTL